MSEKQCIFSIVTGEKNAPLVIIGIPAAAWEHMKDGESHTFDLTKAGVQFQIVLFGGKDRAEVSNVIEDAARGAGLYLVDKSKTDFSIK